MKSRQVIGTLKRNKKMYELGDIEQYKKQHSFLLSYYAPETWMWSMAQQSRIYERCMWRVKVGWRKL